MAPLRLLVFVTEVGGLLAPGLVGGKGAKVPGGKKPSPSSPVQANVSMVPPLAELRVSWAEAQVGMLHSEHSLLHRAQTSHLQVCREPAQGRGRAQVRLPPADKMASGWSGRLS